MPAPAARRLLTLLALATLASCQGCLGCLTSPLDGPDSLLPSACQVEAPLIDAQRLEILFVIDNSNSMVEEQEAVARELTAFVDQLRQAGGVRQDFHVGVITTTVYQHLKLPGVEPWFRTWPEQSGRLRPVPRPLSDGGLDFESGTERVLEGEDPALIAKLGSLVRQGVVGSGQETPFEAVRLALLTDLARVPLEQGGNQGFLRDGSRLLVVIVTDEDDCSERSERNRPSLVKVGNRPEIADCTEQANSLGTVSEYHRLFSSQLVNADGSARELIWTAIAPVSTINKAAMGIVENGQVKNVDCPTSYQAGFRHRSMAELFDPSLVNLGSICDASFRSTLISIAEQASVTQSLEVSGVPDERLVQVTITRRSGATELCTLANEGLTGFTRGVGGARSKISFGNQCRRRSDDTAVSIKLLCAT